MTGYAFKRILVMFLVVIVIIPFGYVRAQTTPTPVAPEQSSSIADSIKNGGLQVWQALENFRLGLFATLARERDAARTVLEESKMARESATLQNRDAVEKGESSTLYSGVGKRIDTVHIGITLKYWFFYVLAGIVSSAIAFYGILVVIIYSILRRVFGRRSL